MEVIAILLLIFSAFAFLGTLSAVSSYLIPFSTRLYVGLFNSVFLTLVITAAIILI